MNQSDLPIGRGALSRRRLLAGGGLLAAGMLAGGGGIAERSPSVARPLGSEGRRPRSGDLPTLSQWYHGYGEEGTQEAVERYAATYEDANIEVEWFAGRLRQRPRLGAAHRRGPRRLRERATARTST